MCKGVIFTYFYKQTNKVKTSYLINDIKIILYILYIYVIHKML